MSDLIEALAAAGIRVRFQGDKQEWEITLPAPSETELSRLKQTHNNLLATLQQMGATLVFTTHNRQWRVDMPQVRELKAMYAKQGEELQVMSQELDAMRQAMDVMQDARDEANDQLQLLIATCATRGVHVSRYIDGTFGLAMVPPVPNSYAARLDMPRHVDAYALEEMGNQLAAQRKVYMDSEVCMARLLGQLKHARIDAKYNPVRNTWQVKNKRMSELLAALRGNGVKVRYETNGGWKIDTNWVGIDRGVQERSFIGNEEVAVPVRGLMGGLFKPVRISDICKAFGVNNPKGRAPIYDVNLMAGLLPRTFTVGDKFHGVPVPHGCSFTVHDTEVSMRCEDLRLMLMSARVH